MATSEKNYVISITSRDRIGIVHDVASEISYLNGDLADIRQQVLRGYFTMILYASFPTEIGLDEIKQKLKGVSTDEATIEVSIKELSRSEPESPPAKDTSYVMTAEGADRIGFVATVTKFCKDNNINILDLTTTVADNRYIMILFVDLSNCTSVDEIRTGLERFADETDLNIVLQHNDIFRATNEIKIF